MKLFFSYSLVFRLRDIAFSDEDYPIEEYLTKENPDETAFYEKINEADKHLNAIRKFAEMKRYFEAQGRGELQEKPVL